jgi:hypothetical protein
VLPRCFAVPDLLQGDVGGVAAPFEGHSHEPKCRWA